MEGQRTEWRRGTVRDEGMEWKEMESDGEEEGGLKSLDGSCALPIPEGMMLRKTGRTT